VDVHLLEDRRVAALRECVARLEGRMREAVERHHLDGASYEATASALGIGMHGIKSLLRRARHALRDCVDNRMREEASS
jgi:DNA-directed RNA polymerase specialized sigma24 family protein